MCRVLAFSALALLSACIQPVEPLNAAGRGFLGSLGYRVIGVSCMDADSDGDGYVSCTARVEGQSAPVAIECASAYSWKSGCRMQRFQARFGAGN